jgi:hypothetical protein
MNAVQLAETADRVAGNRGGSPAEEVDGLAESVIRVGLSRSA